jgi:hypothetical protein
LLSLYIFIKYENLKWQLIGSLVLGLSVILKPTALILLLFLLVISYDHIKKKLKFDIYPSLIRIIGLLLPNSLNVIIFWLYPKLWEGFIAANFTGSNPLTLNFSFSITKIWLNFCYVYNIPFNQIYVLLIVSCIVGTLGFVLFVVGKFEEKFSIIYGFIIGLIIMLLIYYDSWDHHLLNLIPLLILIIFNLPRQSELTNKYIKKGLYFLSYFDIAFMGLWFLTVAWFPYNFATTIFLILIFYGISKFGIERAKITKTEKIR